MIVPPHQIDASIILTTFSCESLVNIPLPHLRTEDKQRKTPVFAVGKVRFKHCTDCLGGEICRRYSFAPKTTLEQVGKLQVLCLSPLLRSHFDAAPATKQIVMDGRKMGDKKMGCHASMYSGVTSRIGKCLCGATILFFLVCFRTLVS